jgi:hypothetical protein
MNDILVTAAPELGDSEATSSSNMASPKSNSVKKIALKRCFKRIWIYSLEYRQWQLPHPRCPKQRNNSKCRYVFTAGLELLVTCPLDIVNFDT